MLLLYCLRLEGAWKKSCGRECDSFTLSRKAIFTFSLEHLSLTVTFPPAEKSPNPSLLRLCGSLAQLACVEPVRLQAWLTRMTMSPPKDSDQLDVVQENRQLLQLLTTYIVRENR